MTAKEIVTKMMSGDSFSQWLGIEVIRTSPGQCTLEMKVRAEMCNGLGVTHGGITYSLADSALAFASNGHGVKAMSIETSISHTAPVQKNDILTAEASEVSLKNKIGIYSISILNQDRLLVATFKGTVYRSSKKWEEEYL